MTVQNIGIGLHEYHNINLGCESQTIHPKNYAWYNFSFTGLKSRQL